MSRNHVDTKRKIVLKPVQMLIVQVDMLRKVPIAGALVRVAIQ